MNRRRCTIWGGFNPGRAECKSSNRPHEDLKCLVAVCGILVDSTVALGEGLSEGDPGSWTRGYARFGSPWSWRHLSAYSAGVR